MNDETPPNHEAPAQPPTPEESTPAPTQQPASQDTKAPSPTVIAIAFIIIVLLGVIIFQNIIPRNGAQGPAESPARNALKADLETVRAELNRERMELGLDPIGGSSSIESADEVAKRLQADADTLASLATSFQELLARKDAQLDEMRTESIAALKDQQRLRELLATANQDLRKAMIDASMATKLQSDLNEANMRIVALQTEIQELRAVPDALRAQLLESQQRESELQSQLLLLQSKLAQLEGQLNQAKLFAANENELLKEAIALVRALRKLQGATPQELSAAYSEFGAELGANVLHICKFATGSSEVSAELQSNLSNLPNEAPENALLLVVGYASETGNVDSNRILSSDRATAVAQELDTLKRVGQQVQAVYLGQTKRFGKDSPLENQRVEVWQVVPKPNSLPPLGPGR
ncbi:OmpA family protein [Haloferula rosea]|uniref:OmpA family protein n=1 Tax=Haloferula rosea TaxID=490093 RepID=A0A934REP0_9BACT|nr:OmpA family protein [Haloferula rosea]MBK1827741.1 OmpA family protein [Haloferula rosea]